MAARSPAELEPLPRTVAEFLAWEEDKEGKYEFCAGEVAEVSPEHTRHVLLKSRIAFLLEQALADRGFYVLTDGTQVRIGDLVAIPDVVVTAETLDMMAVFITGPVLLVEVTSRRRRQIATDRKWLRYARLASLRHYLVVSQEERGIVAHSRVAGDEWRERVLRAGRFELEALGIGLEVEAIYARSGL